MHALPMLSAHGECPRGLRLLRSGMLQWLRQGYGLDLSEATQVLGVAAQYQVVNLAGRSVGVAAKLDKRLLEGLLPPSSKPPANREPAGSH